MGHFAADLGGDGSSCKGPGRESADLSGSLSFWRRPGSGERSDGFPAEILPFCIGSSDLPCREVAKDDPLCYRDHSAALVPFSDDLRIAKLGVHDPLGTAGSPGFPVRRKLWRR